MSETEPTVTDTTVIEEPTPAARNPLVLVGAVVAALAAAIAVWFLLISPLLAGDDDATTPSADAGDMAAGGTADETTDAPDVDAVPDALDDPEELPLVTFEVFLARDPFEPVIPEPVSAAPGDGTLTEDPQPITDGPGAPAPDPGPTDPSDPTRPSDPSDPSDPSNGEVSERSCRNGTETVCDGRSVSYLEVSSDEQGRLAVVQVDTTIYEVREGDTFAREFLVQSITDEAIFLVFGDEVVRVPLGERVLK